MLQRLLSLFQRQSPAERLERELAALEQQMEHAAPDYQPELLVRAAEHCVEAGAEARALSYFGRAIDAYLETCCYGLAASLCERVLRLYPQVVRTRCTLAFLSLGEELPHLPVPALLEQARRELGDYVGAAHRSGHEELAAKRLRLMASVTDRHEIRELIGEYLLDLGDAAGADRVFEAINAERHYPQPPAPGDQCARWARALRLPVVSNPLTP